MLFGNPYWGFVPATPFVFAAFGLGMTSFFSVMERVSLKTMGVYGLLGIEGRPISTWLKRVFGLDGTD